MALEVADKTTGDGSPGENSKPSTSSESVAVPTKKKGIIIICNIKRHTSR